MQRCEVNITRNLCTVCTNLRVNIGWWCVPYMYVHICPYLLILFGLLLRLWSAGGAAAVQQWLNVCHPSIDLHNRSTSSAMLPSFIFLFVVLLILVL